MLKTVLHWDQCGPLSNTLDITTKKIMSNIFYLSYNYFFGKLFQLTTVP